MQPEIFPDTHPLKRAFVANLLVRVADQISDQGEILLQGAGLTLPARTVSTVLLISERQKMSAADIAEALGQPHQLATQRIDLLIKSGLIQRSADPDDGRRKVLSLTEKGAAEVERLQLALARADAVVAGLFDEIGADLCALLERTSAALSKATIAERAKSLGAPR